MAGKKKNRQRPVAEFKADYREKGNTPVEERFTPPPPEEEIAFSADYRDKGEKASLDAAPRRERESFDEALNAPQSGEAEEALPAAQGQQEEGLATGGDILTEEDASGEEEENEFSKERAQLLGDFLKEQRHGKRRGRRRYGVAAGSAVLLLALIGVVFLAVTAGQAIFRFATDDSALRAYDEWLAPVVMQDPAPFESISQADPDMVMTASLRSAISLAGPDTFTSYDSQGRTLVPLGLVDGASKALFGPECTLRARTPDEDTFFTFESEDNQFHVAPFSTQTSYQPYTESIQKSGNSEILRVGYVSPADDSYGVKSGEAKPAPVKYMEYVVKKNTQTGENYISAIRTAQ